MFTPFGAFLVARAFHVAEFRYIDIFISPVFSIFGDFFIACKFHVSEVEKL